MICIYLHFTFCDDLLQCWAVFCIFLIFFHSFCTKVRSNSGYTWQKTLCYSFIPALTPKHEVSLESHWKALHLDVNYLFVKWKRKEINEKENVALLNGEILFRKSYIIWILITWDAQKYMVVWKNMQYFRRYKGF